jgi:cardiolipin synthase (CMP-forming)
MNEIFGYAKMLNIPNLLTMVRIILIPVMVCAFYSQTLAGRWLAFAVFCLSCVTDFLDGFMARIMYSTTKLGQFLDPIADKLLITSSLLLLAGFGYINSYNLIPAILILCREITISGLREFCIGMEIKISVSPMAKWKTTVQMFAIGFLILGDFYLGSVQSKIVGNVLLWIAAVMTLLTGFYYVRSAYKQFSH